MNPSTGSQRPLANLNVSLWQQSGKLVETQQEPGPMSFGTNLNTPCGLAGRSREREREVTRSEDTNEANVTSRPPFQFKRNARFSLPGTVAPTAGSACQPGLHRFPFSFSERPKGSWRLVRETDPDGDGQQTLEAEAHKATISPINTPTNSSAQLGNVRRISKQPHSTVMDADKRSMDGVATIFPLPQPPRAWVRSRLP